jgi:CubicO group peptidase (beta-lactamase class C family)
MKMSLCGLICALVAGWSGAARAAPTAGPISPAEIDRAVTRAMAEFSVPGIAVGIVKDGQLVFAKGYGVRTIGQPGKVDADTLFAIGSNTKAFTAAALAILVDEGKLHWDDRVIDHLPDFRMWDPFVTREFTVRDLLTHRSGLGLGAGDLLFVTPTDFTRRDILHALRFLKPVSSFRSEFAYDNLLYAVAGELVPAVTGQSWEDFVTQRILKPLHMDACAVATSRLADRGNLASPHSLVAGKLQTVEPLDIPAAAPAGSIQCNVTGLAKWVSTQLAHGRAPDGTVLFSEAQGAEMWSAQTILRPSGKRAEMTRTHFAAYGLGWGLEDFEGYKRVSHNGGLPGMVTHVGMIPELGLGVVVLTNQQEGAVLTALPLQILEAYTGAPKRDWVGLVKAMSVEREQRIREADANRAPDAVAATSAANLDAYVGTFADPWRGEASVTRTAGGLELRFSHTDDLEGPLLPRGNNLFVVRWNDRSLNADAYVRFTEDFTGKVVGFTMQAVSAATDFSFDFQDLDFKRTGAPPVAGTH